MMEPTSAQELFKGRHFDQEIIVLCVRWYLILTTLRRIEFRQFVEACGYVGMVRAERLFPDGERALETRLGLRVIALVVIQSSQVVQVLSHIGREGLKRSPLHRGLSRYVMGRQDLLLR
jgi:hypothetical protein